MQDESTSRSRPRESYRLRVPSYSSSRPPSPSRVHPRLRTSSSSQSLRIQFNKAKSTISMPTTPSRTAIPPFLSQNPRQEAVLMESSSSGIDVEEGPSTLAGILVGDADQAEPEIGDGDEGSAIGQFENTATSESSRKQLREQLKRSLTKTKERERSTHTIGPKSYPSDFTLSESEVIEVDQAADDYPPRQYYALTDAGKPVFISRSAKDQDESAIGVMQALISVFLDDGDKLKFINAGPTRISFLIRSPLYYVCVSSWREPESVTRSHLEYLHLQILSVVSGAQLRRIFEKRTNFDLRRLLGGAETFLHSLIERLECDLAMGTSSLQCLKVEPTLRAKISEILIPGTKMKDILYILLVARGRVVTVIRPKKHSVHPSDLHILLNTIHAPSVFDSSASWLPICLPKYDSSAFMQTYVSFLRNDEVEFEEDKVIADASSDKTLKVNETPLSEASTNQQTQDDQNRSISTGVEVPPDDDTESDANQERRNRPYIAGGSGTRLGIGLVCVTSSGDFEGIRGWSESVSAKLQTEGHLDALCHAIRDGSCEYSTAEVGIPGLRHFVYKSRAHVQVTAPSFERPYDGLNARRRLITLYQILHDAIHAKSGQEKPLKLQYIRTDRESVMGWITQPFEVYIALSPKLPKAAAVNAANAVSRWVKREEARLFLRDAPVF